MSLWEKYQQVITDVDGIIAAHLLTIRRPAELPPLGRKPHEPKFDLRIAVLYYATGVDLTNIECIDQIYA